MTTNSPLQSEEISTQWDCISTAEDWQTHGGAWLQEINEFAFLTIIVRSTKGWAAAEKNWYGYVTYVDVMEMTWPEIKDAVGWDVKKPKKITARMAEQVNMNLLGKGKGTVLGHADGDSAEETREKCANLADAWRVNSNGPAREVKVLSMNERKWNNHKKANPSEYMVGYKAGLARKDAWDSMSEIEESGWRHGWEVAIHRIQPMEEA